MPQKSTFFYPKVPTGLAIHTLEPGAHRGVALSKASAAFGHCGPRRPCSRRWLSSLSGAQGEGELPAGTAPLGIARRSARKNNAALRACIFGYSGLFVFYCATCRARAGRGSSARGKRDHVGKEADAAARARKTRPIQFGDELPVLPIRNAVLFPGAVAPFDVGREKSVALVEDVDNLTVARSSPSSPSAIRRPTIRARDDLHQVGCAARVLKALKHSSGNYSLILQGLDAHPARRGHADGALPEGEGRAASRRPDSRTTRPRRSA